MFMTDRFCCSCVMSSFGLICSCFRHAWYYGDIAVQCKHTSAKDKFRSEAVDEKARPNVFILFGTISNRDYCCVVTGQSCIMHQIDSVNHDGNSYTDPADTIKSLQPFFRVDYRHIVSTAWPKRHKHGRLSVLA